MLQTLVVVIRGETKERSIRAIIDTGSQRSYILRTTAQEMGYKFAKEEEIIHSLFGGNLSEPCHHLLYKVRVKHLNNSYACNFDVLDQTTICSDIPPIKGGPWLNELQQFGIQVSDLKSGPIELLIGADVAGKLLTGRRHILSCGMVAVDTLLGWTVMGKYPTNSHEPLAVKVTSMLIKDADVAKLWSLDVLGIEDPKDKQSRKDLELAALEHFQQSVIIKEDGRYEVGLPWLEEHPPLPSNYKMAEKRLYNNVKQLQITGNYETYDKVLTEWKNEGIIEELPSSLDKTVGHFLPHRAVIKTGSTTPVRPVFDASAKEKHFPSLNECLEKGANLIEQIPSILLRFRLDKVGVIADIKKAFLQIGLQKKDREFLKFLWLDDSNNIKVFCHTRVVFGVSSSPFLLGAVIEHHLQNCLKHASEGNGSFDEDIILKLTNSFYVDNLVTSLSTTSILNSFIKQATAIFSIARFELRGWEYTNYHSDPLKETSVLGLNWCTATDSLSLKLDMLNDLKLEKVTKRAILSLAHSLFDPVGFVSPVVLLPKLLLQETWSLKLGWDEEVPEDVKLGFLKWYAGLCNLKNLRVPRWLSGNSNDVSGWSIHVFVDASKLAYACAIFLRIESEEGVVVNLIHAKSRVAPKKQMTIPRLELMAAVIGVRLAQSVLSALSPLIVPCFFWSDSTTVLSWIQRPCQWSVFVRNRVAEILQKCSKDSWKHIPGAVNPADLLSRGCSPRTLVESKWWEGAPWMKLPLEDWPHSHYVCNENEINEEKLKGLSTSLISNSSGKKDVLDYSSYYQYFSRFSQIVRMIGWMTRFCHNSRYPKEKISGDLTLGEVQRATVVVIKLVQFESFSGVNDKFLKPLKVIKDKEGLLRVETKIIQRNDFHNFRFPVILPGNHPVVKRLILEEHI